MDTDFTEDVLHILDNIFLTLLFQSNLSTKIKYLLYFFFKMAPMSMDAKRNHCSMWF